MKFKKDKLYHFLAGMLIFISMSILFTQTIAIILVWVAGVGKEIYDSFFPKKHTADIVDIIATTIIPTVIYLGYLLWKL